MERCRCQNTVDELEVERQDLRDRVVELMKTVDLQNDLIMEMRKTIQEATGARNTEERTQQGG